MSDANRQALNNAILDQRMAAEQRRIAGMRNVAFGNDISGAGGIKLQSPPPIAVEMQVSALMEMITEAESALLGLANRLTPVFTSPPLPQESSKADSSPYSPATILSSLHEAIRRVEGLRSMIAEMNERLG